MKPISEVLEPLGSGISKARTRRSSSTDGNGPGGPGNRRGEGDGREPEEDRCPRCGGLGWLRRDVPVEHPDFGKAFPCDCIAERLADRRLEGVRRASNMAALDGMTFDTFETDAPGNSPEGMRSLRVARDAAHFFARQPEGWLVLQGSYGCGKTHLAAAIVNERLRAGHAALFVVVPDLLDHLRAAFSPTSEEAYDDRFEAVRSAPLLVLDDLGTQAPTPWAAEKLFQILNHRYNARLPTVITTNWELEDLDERLRSRLGHVGFVRPFRINALDYRGGIHPDGAELSSLHHYADMTFQTWDQRTADLERPEFDNLANALNRAHAFAESPQDWLVFVGAHGCGKTHLAAAIANHRVALGGSALFIVVPDLLDHLRATFGPSSRVPYDKRFEEVRSTSLLVLDDLGTESATPWAQEKLFQILNHRYAARLPTVITMSTAIKDVHPRLRTRMLDKTRSTVFEILAPSYHERLVRAARRPRR
jgi:DNA replication protein DnaC